MPGPVLGAGEETMNDTAMASAVMGVTVLVGTKKKKKRYVTRQLQGNVFSAVAGIWCTRAFF